ncbi:MAG: hypothetical protein A2X12_02290 [Bacteroidetes bacterium GWE2_29_8]|nr:MAG: hypothetical protein A2X12_02290 [Bacteroidetes bacterium GWE2_29_8]OFY19164.1 MAG: hypothetical protein A2X02_01600 [Bacteroidetes bacterium GWF2_29_10]
MKNNKYLTILTIITFLLIIYFFTNIKLLITGAIVLGLISMLSYKVTTFIHYVWFKIAEGMGYVMSRLLLTLIFYVILFPIALLSKLFGNKSYIIKNKKADSYYFIRNHAYTAKDLENMW